ncbi:MAG: hypothetical protein ABT11_04100 [Novosphingobium sp. SCN 66-18]|nr:MAG: hypothetical protein ABT11_04100 [Novosphingobium sp. SCN 66-18]
MTDAKSITELVAFQQLDGAVTGATVYQDAPEGAMLPIVVVGDMKSTPIGGKGDRDRRISLLIQAEVSAEERAPLLALQKQIEDALDGLTIAQDGWTLAFTFEDDDAQLGEDGGTYIGTSAFAVLALQD